MSNYRIPSYRLKRTDEHIFILQGNALSGPRRKWPLAAFFQLPFQKIAGSGAGSLVVIDWEKALLAGNDLW